MNSTQVALRRKIFNVDSRYRTNGTNSNFDITLNMPFRHNFNTVCPLVVEIPKTYYMLDSSTTNTLAIESPIGTSLGSITITSGRNYDADELATEIESKLNTAPFNTGVWDVTANANTGKFHIINDTATFNIDFTGAKLLARYFGFEQTDYDSVTDSGSEVLDSVNYANLQRYDFFIIRSNIALNNNNNKLVTVYPNSYDEGSVIRYETADTMLTCVGMANTRANSFNFVLLDGDTNDEINLNGSNWRMLFSCSEEVLPAVPIPQ